MEKRLSHSKIVLMDEHCSGASNRPWLSFISNVVLIKSFRDQPGFFRSNRDIDGLPHEPSILKLRPKPCKKAHPCRRT